MSAASLRAEARRDSLLKIAIDKLFLCIYNALSVEIVYLCARIGLSHFNIRLRKERVACDSAASRK